MKQMDKNVRNLFISVCLVTKIHSIGSLLLETFDSQHFFPRDLWLSFGGNNLDGVAARDKVDKKNR